MSHAATITQEVHAPGRRERLRRSLSLAPALPVAFLARTAARTRWSSRFAGLYGSREDAERAARRIDPKGYDSEDIADISFEMMSRRASWDYPVLFWLARLLPNRFSVLDAGGHLGTKYIAFSDVLDVGALDWTVYDLPGIVRAARKRQTSAEIPSEIRFVDRLSDVPPCDVLLASGLLQYFDSPFAAFVESMSQRPKIILLNKVALRDGPGQFTLERIGRGRVTYHIRSRTDWAAEIDAMGYDMVDEWRIPELAHAVPTHPWLPASDSRGCVLICREARDALSTDFDLSSCVRVGGGPYRRGPTRPSTDAGGGKTPPRPNPLSGENRCHE